MDSTIKQKQYIREFPLPQTPTKKKTTQQNPISCTVLSIMSSSTVIFHIKCHRLAASPSPPQIPLTRAVILVPLLTGLEIITRYQTWPCLARNLSLPPPIVLVSGDGQDIPFAEREFLGNRSLVHIHRSCWESLAKRQHTRYQPKTHHNARSPFHPL